MSLSLYDRVSHVYNSVNLSGRIYQKVLSQEALIQRSSALLRKVDGVVYRPGEYKRAPSDPRGFPASTVIDVRTAFWVGATGRAAAQRTVSAMGLFMVADATSMMGARGLAVWGNHPAAVVIRASLPLRVAAWPLSLWNQNLLTYLTASPLAEIQIGSGLAEYVIGTGYLDRPQNPQSAPGYLVAAPPAFENFKVDGVLGLPERALRSFAHHHRKTAPIFAAGVLAGACVLRVVKQVAAISLCAVWGCEIMLGGLVGVAHVLANHALQALTVAAQEIGSRLHLNQKPSEPCTLGSFQEQITQSEPQATDEQESQTPSDASSSEQSGSTPPSSSESIPRTDEELEPLASYADEDTQRPGKRRSANHSVESHGAV